MSAKVIECASRIDQVVVYARGAIVTRRVELKGPLPDGAIEIAVQGITPLAETGSLRALLGPAPAHPAGSAEGDGSPEREVVGIRARLVVPPAAAEKSSLAARLRELELEIVRLTAEQTNLRWRRDLLGSVALEPELTRRLRPVNPAARIQDALAVSELLASETAALDVRIAELDAELERARREQQATQLEAAQATSSEMESAAEPRLDVAVRLSPRRAGAASAGALRVEYAVLPARWWPAYAARFSKAATQVEWQVDALVAQASGEDWSDVHLALSTADLVQDTRLPTLASLRFSRAQRPPKRAYRPAPEGLDAMFDGFDRFVASLPNDTHDAPTLGASATVRPEPPPALEGSLLAMPYAAPHEAPAYAPLPRMQAMVQTAVALAPQAPLRAEPMAPMAMPAAPARRTSVPVPPPPPAARPEAHALNEDSLVVGETTEVSGRPGFRAANDAGIEPGERWLDFDALELAANANAPQRGRLVRHEPGPRRNDTARAVASIEEVDVPPRAVDPRASRGQFDHRYEGDGTVDVPSNRRPHRVTLTTAQATSTPRFVSVPREACDVYREALVKNPLAAPLLAGPVDVFVDGALAAQSALGHVDRGGVIRVGLGVEERLRVARNARVDESSAGLLGASLAVAHAVTIDLSSSLGRRVDVEIIDRIPVTDEKDVEVKLVSAQPKPQPYTQEEVGEPVRGGMRWVVPLAPGGKASIAFTYRVNLPAKNEIVGGNRRE